MLVIIVPWISIEHGDKLARESFTLHEFDASKNSVTVKEKFL